MQGDAKLEQRVVTAAEEILARQKSVSALEMLSHIGWLPWNVVEHWQRGRIPDLSTALTMKPEKKKGTDNMRTWGASVNALATSFQLNSSL